MKYFKTLAIVPTLAVALAGLLITNTAFAEWYKPFDGQVYPTKDTRSGSPERFADSGTVTTDAVNADEEKLDEEKRRGNREMVYEITKNLP